MTKKVEPLLSVGVGKSFKRVSNFVGIFKDQVLEVSEQEMEKASKKFADTVRTIIFRQLYKWRPLSSKYLAWKKKKKLDERILIATKTYVQSIKALPRRYKGKVVSWTVSPGRPNSKHKPSGLNLHDLARLLEFGSKDKKMPARPHWRPAWSTFMRRDSKLVKQNIRKRAFKEAWQKSKAGK